VDATVLILYAAKKISGSNESAEADPLETVPLPPFQEGRTSTMSFGLLYHDVAHPAKREIGEHLPFERPNHNFCYEVAPASPRCGSDNATMAPAVLRRLDRCCPAV
jgi:hypothetical protein